LAVFGNEIVGSSFEAHYHTIAGSFFRCPEVGVLDSINTHLKPQEAGYIKAAAYKKSDGVLVGKAEEIYVQPGEGLYTLNFAGVKPPVENVDYCLVIYTTMDVIYYFDIAEEGKGVYQEGLTAFPDILSPTIDARKYSIYATYTPGPPPPTHRLSLNSSPEQGCTISVDGIPYSTNIDIDLPEGEHILEAPASYSHNGLWNFDRWEDGSTDLVRTINLLSGMTVTAYYILAPPDTHLLAVNSTPITGIKFTIKRGDEMVEYPTNWSGTLEEATYIITLSQQFVDAEGNIWHFQRWSDDHSNTNPERAINLLNDTTLNAEYELAPLPPSIPLWKVGAVAAAVVIPATAVVLTTKKEGVK